MTRDLDADERAAWHKRFAMEANNRAWALAARTRSPAEEREMLDAAHTAAWHWAAIGTELHRMRAMMLLAEVHALLGQGATALRYATAMADYFLTRSETPDWERAFTQVVTAHAAHAAGEHALHRSAYAAACDALAAIRDAEDAAIVRQSFDQVPPPTPSNPP